MILINICIIPPQAAAPQLAHIMLPNGQLQQKQIMAVASAPQTGGINLQQLSQLCMCIFFVCFSTVLCLCKVFFIFFFQSSKLKVVVKFRIKKIEILYVVIFKILVLEIIVERKNVFQAC